MKQLCAYKPVIYLLFSRLQKSERRNSQIHCIFHFITERFADHNSVPFLQGTEIQISFGQLSAHPSLTGVLCDPDSTFGSKREMTGLSHLQGTYSTPVKQHQVHTRRHFCDFQERKVFLSSMNMTLVRCSLFLWVV